MASPAFAIEGTSVSLGSVAVSAASGITATLLSIDGVDSVEWTMIRADELTDPAVDYTLVQSGSVGQTVQFTSLAALSAATLKCTINNGVDPATGNLSDDMTATGKFYVGPFEVGCAAEPEDDNREASPTHGMIKWVNTLLRAAASALAGVSSTADGIVSAFGVTPNLVFCSDGSTAGGSWRSYLAALSYVSFGAAPPSLGTQRWSDNTTVRGLDHAGTGEAQLMDWGDTIADHLTIGSNNANLDGVDIVAGAAGEFDVRVGAATNLRVSATTVSTPANAIWSLGTNYITHGASPATAGTYRRTDTENDTWLHGGNNYALCSGQGTTAILGGPYPTRPTTAAVDAATTTELRVAGTALVSCTASAVAVGVNALTFGATLVTPTVGQADDATASVTCDNTIYGAQRATNAAGGASAARSGCPVLEAPTAGGHADNYDGNIALISAPPANLSTLGAEKCCFFGKAVAAPTLAPTNGHIIYVDPTTENLMALGESNTLTTLALK